MRQTMVGSLGRALAVAILATLTISATAQTEKVLHSFDNFGGSDGNFPLAGLVSDAKGNLYGTASQGGSGACSGCGIVFELSPGSGGTWTETILHTFSGSPDGISPTGALVFDGKGNLYGTTQIGGTSELGTIFELTPGSDGTWTETVLYSFVQDSGSYPGYAALTLDGAGNLYGTTSGGGTTNPGFTSFEFGNVFELVAGSNGTWTQEVLYNFTGRNDGGSPFASTLSIDKSGDLYGVAAQLGAHDNGVVFKLTKNAKGVWSQKVLYAFPGGAGGTGPTGNLVFDAAGNIYGTATNIVFELSPTTSGTYTETTLHTFTGDPDGANCGGGLVVDKSGNLYGTTNVGGAHRGVVFELSLSTSGMWTEKILHRFPVAPTAEDGAYPGFATLLLDGSGNLYGTTPGSLPDLGGVVFEIKP